MPQLRGNGPILGLNSQRNGPGWGMVQAQQSGTGIP
jgi:hypothetical protein